ncbi:SH3 domain-containing protein [Nephila pilipes]|uniref:SH3 domain-containing protein n=1 Tax=Nephila pilipes TaxID=299642 RepID=A0A8X6U0U7_NEPPI|nr:SH3 domain-containing protein [Nephila pilipes]
MGICWFSKQSVQNEQVSVRHSDIVEEGEAENKSIQAVALYPLHSDNSVILNFEAGDRLIIEDDNDPDWYLARHINDQKRGFVPKSYLVQDVVGNAEYVYSSGFFLFFR